MTGREYEVFGLLADRLGNKAIAARLHISPRTVEKHVASLVAKAGQPNRESHNAYAAAFFIRWRPGLSRICSREARLLTRAVERRP